MTAIVTSKGRGKGRSRVKAHMVNKTFFVETKNDVFTNMAVAYRQTNIDIAFLRTALKHYILFFVLIINFIFSVFKFVLKIIECERFRYNLITYHY